MQANASIGQESQSIQTQFEDQTLKDNHLIVIDLIAGIVPDCRQVEFANESSFTHGRGRNRSPNSHSSVESNTR